MDDLNDPRISAYKPQRRLLIPAPPGPKRRRRPTKADREHQARVDARDTRLHLVGLTDAWMIATGVLLAVIAVMLVLVLMSHH